MIFNKKNNKLLLLIIIICIIIFISLLYVYYYPKHIELFTNYENILSKYKESIINITNLINNINDNKIILSDIVINNDLTVTNDTKLNKLNIKNQGYIKKCNFETIALNNNKFYGDGMYDLFNIQTGIINVNKITSNKTHIIKFNIPFINTPKIILNIQNIESNKSTSSTNSIDLREIIKKSTNTFFEIYIDIYNNINYNITWIAIP